MLTNHRFWLGVVVGIVGLMFYSRWRARKASSK